MAVTVGLVFCAGSVLAGCGAATTDDPSGAKAGSESVEAAISSLPDSVEENYEGYSTFTKIHPNAYVDYKAPKGPWKFCFSTTNVGNSWSRGTQAELTRLVKLYEDKGLAKSGLKTTVSNDSVALQISQTKALVDEGCDVIFSIPGSPTALCPVIEDARKSGVLYITDDTAIDCPDAINVTLNVYQTMYESTKAVMKAMGDEGNILVLLGATGAVNTRIKDSAVKAAMKDSGTKRLGEIVGNFNSSVAQTATAQFLATHPQPIDGMVDLGGMALGGELALEQAGRPLATVNTYEASCSEVAFQRENPNLVAVALNQGPGPAAFEAFNVAARMLSGQQPKLNTLFYPIPGPSDETINDWFKPGMTVKSDCFAADPNGRTVPDAYWDDLFEGGEGVPLEVTP